MHMRPWAERLRAVSALTDSVRRALYDLVLRSAGPVSRDTAAERLGLARSTAAFHLDRLADAGLLEVDFVRLSGRTGPGAGRPAKVYRATGEVAASVPDRRYDLAGELLAAAVEESAATDQPVLDVLGRLARERGEALAAAAGSLEAMLTEWGFEPRDDGAGGVELGNCPFHRLAQRHAATVCDLNLALLRGAASATGLDEDTAVLDPAPGRCCVRLTGAG